jgi:hypothetical protein
LLIPATDPLSVLAAGLILCVYGLVSCFGLPKILPAILHWAGFFGAIAGIIILGEIVLEYIVFPKDNTN